MLLQQGRLSLTLATPPTRHHLPASACLPCTQYSQCIVPCLHEAVSSPIINMNGVPVTALRCVLSKPFLNRGFAEVRF